MATLYDSRGSSLNGSEWKRQRVEVISHSSARSKVIPGQGPRYVMLTGVPWSLTNDSYGLDLLD